MLISHRLLLFFILIHLSTIDFSLVVIMHKRPLNKGLKKASSISHTDIESVPVDTSISNGPNLYHIGNEIGRGGFGIVYQAFNASTGQTVAVKRFLLHSIDKESLSSIEVAIEFYASYL